MQAKSRFTESAGMLIGSALLLSTSPPISTCICSRPSFRNETDRHGHRRYPLIFGSWCKQLAVEVPLAKSIEKSTRAIIKRSRSPAFQQRAMSLLKVTWSSAVHGPSSCGLVPFKERGSRIRRSGRIGGRCHTAEGQRRGVCLCHGKGVQTRAKTKNVQSEDTFLIF